MTCSIILYTNPISDCAARVRIALNLKNLPYKSITVDMASQENLNKEYIEINPSGTIPTLVISELGVSESTPSSDTPRVILTQSLAALEYLEEGFLDSRRLLPPLNFPMERAYVRTLMEVIASDTHPLTSPRVSRFIQDRFWVPFDSAVDKSDAIDQMSVKKWDKYWIMRGLMAYEKTLVKGGMTGRYSLGDEITLADIVLVPELWTAEDFGVDLEAYPSIMNIYREMMKVEEVREARQKGKGFGNK